LHFGVEPQLRFQLVQVRVLLHFGVEPQLRFQERPIAVGSWLLVLLGFQEMSALALVVVLEDQLLVLLGFQEMSALALVVVLAG
jgi:hypothetical protein